MKKRIAKLSALICIIALVLTAMLALAACGNAGTNYNYSGTNAEIINGNTSSPDASMKTLYDTMYKDSTITVSDSKIVWKISDVESAMTVKKDGDKYILSGEYVEQMKTALSAGFSAGGVGVSVSFDMYGIETETGFDIIMNASASVNVGSIITKTGTKLTISFAK